MSLFDKLPLDITEIIYKSSLDEHIKNLHSNVVVFHLKHAERRLSYHFILFTNSQQFNQDVFLLMSRIDTINTKDSWRGIQDKLFYIHVLCKLIFHNEPILIENGYQSLVHN